MQVILRGNGCSIELMSYLGQSAEAVEYTNCFSAEG